MRDHLLCRIESGQESRSEGGTVMWRTAVTHPAYGALATKHEIHRHAAIVLHDAVMKKDSVFLLRTCELPACQ